MTPAERYKRWAAAHPERIKEIAAKCRAKRKAKIRAYEKVYWAKRPELRRAKRARQRARKHKALPKWITPKMLGQISGFYRRARSMAARTGVEYHVDHVVPLRGKNVCGLHVPWNLQILTAEENRAKRDKLLFE